MKWDLQSSIEPDLSVRRTASYPKMALTRLHAPPACRLVRQGLLDGSSARYASRNAMHHEYICLHIVTSMSSQLLE